MKGRSVAGRRGDPTAGRENRGVALAVAGGGSVLIAAQAAAMVSNLGFHVLASHRLGPNAYGALGALLAVIAALTIPVGTFQTLLCTSVAHHRDRGETFDIRRPVRVSIAAGVGLAALVALATPLATKFLHLSSPWPWLLVAAYAVPAAATVVPWAVLCGEHRFAAVGATALLNAVARICLAAVLLVAGFSLKGALAASVLAESIQALILYQRACTVVRRHTGRIQSRLTVERGRALRGTVALGGLWLVLGLDVVAVRHFFPGLPAGRYVAAATATRLSLYFAQVVCVLTLPRFAVADQARAGWLLRRVLAVCAGGGLVMAALLGVVGPRLLPLAFGTQFDADRSLIVTLGLSATALGLLWVVVQFGLARSRPVAAQIWATVGLALLACAVFHRAPVDLGIDLFAAIGLGACLAAGARQHQALRGRRLALRPATALAPLAAPDLDISVVVPFYNPGAQLRPNVLNLLESLRRCGSTFEVITVSDGCTDDSPRSIADLDGGELRRLSLPRNQGKGAALRLGLREGRGRYIGFIDADGDLDPGLWEPFVALIGLYRPDVVIGSKVHPLSRVDPGTAVSRRVCSVGYRVLVGVLFPGLPVRDTQVGIKVFRRELLDDVLPRTVERGFVFDLELLVAARRMGYRRVLAAPVEVQARDVSTVNGWAVRRMLVETLGLAWRLYGRRGYDPPVVAAEAAATGNSSEVTVVSDATPLAA